MNTRVLEYICEDGANPYKSWFDGLDPQAAAKVTTAILRLEMGNTANIKWLKGIGELKINGSSLFHVGNHKNPNQSSCRVRGGS